jgi:hypothetical protein
MAVFAERASVRHPTRQSVEASDANVVIGIMFASSKRSDY